MVKEEAPILATPRYASWRRGASSIASPRKLPLPVASTFVAAGLGAAIFIEVAKSTPVVKLPTLLAVAIATIVVIQFVKFIGRISSPDEKVSPNVPWDALPPEIIRLNVLMDVVQGEAITGSDSGVAWMEQGAFCFAGSSTSFALSQDLIAWDAILVKTEVNRPFERSVVVPLRSQDGSLPLRVQFDVPAGPREPGSSVLREMLRRFKDAPPSGVLSQLPPRELGPGAFRSSEITLIAVIYLIQWICFGVMPVLLVGYAVLCRSPFAIFWLALAVLGVVNSGFGSFRRAVDAKAQLEEMRDHHPSNVDSATEVRGS